MAALTFLCYWGGDVLHPFDGPHFANGPKYPLLACSRWNYSTLIDKLYEATGVNRIQFNLTMLCRFPISTNHGITEYFTLPITDDNGTDVMFSVSDRCVGISTLLLYVDIKLIDNREEQEFLERDYDVGLSSQNVGLIVPTPTPEAAYGQPQEEQNETDSEDDEEDDEDLLDARLEDDNDEDSFSDSDGNEGIDGEENLRVPETPEIRLDERAQCPFYNDIGEGSTIASNDQFSLARWDEENDPIVSGLRFPSKKSMQYAMKKHHIKTNRAFKVKRSTNKTWAIECRLKNFPCNFYLRGSLKLHGMWEVTKYNGPHCCLYSGVTEDHQHIDAKFIGREIIGLVKADPDLKIGVIIEEIKKAYEKNVSYRKAWCGKQKAIAEVYGDWKESYQRLPRVLAAIKQYNPRTVVKYFQPPAAGELGMFDRVFWAYGPCLEAFAHCRPVISVDGTFLHGRYKGVILIAMGVDANDSILPLAFAVVEKEDYRNWSWFLYLVRKYVVNDREVCLISDRHGGILQTIASERGWQNVHHRFCLRHMRANFLDKHKGKNLKKLFWIAGCAHQPRKLEKVLEQIKVVDREAIKWFEFLDRKKWSLAYDGGYRYGIMTTNLSEVFNGVMKGARGMPITAIVETSFYRCVQYFHLRSGIARNALGAGTNPQHQFSYKVNQRYTYNEEKAGRHSVIVFNTSEVGVYSVTTGRRGERGGNVQTVRIGDRTCTCGKWVAYNVPCSHVIACCKRQRVDARNYVSPYYNLDSYCKTWSGTFQPLDHEDYWQVDHVPLFFPNPDHQRGARKGRPRSRRIRNSMDFQVDKRTIHCSICKKEGHTRRKCPTVPRD